MLSQDTTFSGFGNPNTATSQNFRGTGDLDRVLKEAVDITTTDGCPPQRCPFIYIPSGCEESESFIYNGKTCYKCPTTRKDCGQEEVRCPPQLCPSIYIPPECQDKIPYPYQGQTCYDCPGLKNGCIPNGFQSTNTPLTTNSGADPECPPVKCPLILIPKECEEKQLFQYKGGTCYGCPKWRNGCAPKNSNIIEPVINNIACPLFNCPVFYIGIDCLEEQPYDFQGKVCYMCPKRRKGCIPFRQRAIPTGGIIGSQPASWVSKDSIVYDDTVACPLFKCPIIRIPAECSEEDPYDFNGQTCFKCPRWRPGCVPSNNNTSSRRKCPVRENCLPLEKEIPCECREKPSYIFEGHICYDCTTFREGCVPAKSLSSPDVRCPLMACPMIYIPPECSVEHPYEFQGKTCYKCPTLKTPCNAGEGDMGRRIECPLLECPDVRIPAECREIKTYDFQGRPCNKCPLWKTDCSPSEPVMTTDSQRPPSVKPPVTEAPGLADAACSVPKCQRIHIPEECKLVQSYQFQGKTCYKCPIWRPGCLPGSSKPKPTKSAPNDKSTGTGSSSSSELTLWRLLMEANIAAISCPSLRCPRTRIPAHCQQQTTYIYKGKTCTGCPTWSSRCESRNMNMNG